MATFVKGNSVQVCPRKDWNWDQWSAQHTEFCDKIGDVTEVKFEQWTNQLFVEVEHRGARLWFLDRHLIKVENYNETFSESIHAAAKRLNETEEICKRLRDEILSDVFDPDNKCERASETKTREEELDQLSKDWQELTTTEVIPLPGNGGTMTTPTDPKDTADLNRTKIRKIKSLGKKMIKKGKQNISGSLSSDWTLTDEELKELEEYIDALPNSNTSTSGDYDANYGYNDEWDFGDGNAD